MIKEIEKKQNNPLLKCVRRTAASFSFTKLRVQIYDSKLQEEETKIVYTLKKRPKWMLCNQQKF